MSAADVASLLGLVAALAFVVWANWRPAVVHTPWSGR